MVLKVYFYNLTSAFSVGLSTHLAFSPQLCLRPIPFVFDPPIPSILAIFCVFTCLTLPPLWGKHVSFVNRMLPSLTSYCIL